MRIYIGSDHAGFELKEKLKIYLEKLNYEVTDKGAFSLDNNDDYPDFIKPVAEEVAKNENSFGIILGGSGQGEAMCANRLSGVRAVVYYGGENFQTDINGNKMNIITGARLHNNANVLSLGARFINEEEAKEVVKLFIETPFSNDERHIRRINKI